MEEEEKKKEEEEKKMSPTLVRAGLTHGVIRKELFLKEGPAFCSPFQFLFSPSILMTTSQSSSLKTSFCELPQPVLYPAVRVSLYFQVDRKEKDI